MRLPLSVYMLRLAVGRFPCRAFTRYNIWQDQTLFFVHRIMDAKGRASSSDTSVLALYSGFSAGINSLADPRSYFFRQTSGVATAY